MRIFDAHFHIIDFDFPVIENQGYTPPSYIVEDYQKETALFNIEGAPLFPVPFKDLIKIIY